MSPEETERERELRYSSRKWNLVNGTVDRYTLIHVLNAALIVLCMSRGWLSAEMIKDLWIASLTIWSVGTLSVVGWYMKK